jgi:hypothetical protein
MSLVIKCACMQGTTLLRIGPGRGMATGFRLGFAPISNWQECDSGRSHKKEVDLNLSHNTHV